MPGMLRWRKHREHPDGSVNWGLVLFRDALGKAQAYLATPPAGRTPRDPAAIFNEEALDAVVGAAPCCHETEVLNALSPANGRCCRPIPPPGVLQRA